MGERLWQQKIIRSLLIIPAVAGRLIAQPLPLSCVTPDTASGAGYCVTRHPLAMADHFEQQLRLCAPGGGKEFSDLQVAALRALHKSLDLEKSLKAIKKKREVEEATERRKLLDLIVLPTLKK